LYDYSRFSITLQHLVSALLFFLQLTMSIYLFATLTESECLRDWIMNHGTSVEYVDSWIQRSRAQNAFLFLLATFFLSMSPTSMSWVPMWVSNIGIMIRSKLVKTGSMRKLAPAYTFFCLLVCLLFMATVTAHIIVGIMATFQKRKFETNEEYAMSFNETETADLAIVLWNLEQIVVVLFPGYIMCSCFVVMSDGTRTISSIRKFIATSAFTMIVVGISLKAFDFIDYSFSDPNVRAPRLFFFYFIPSWLAFLLVGLVIAPIFYSIVVSAQGVLSTYSEVQVQSFLQKMLYSTFTAGISM
jgi:hypothetical protein